MRTSSFVQKAFALAVSLGSPIMGAVPIEDLSIRAVKDMRLDPNGLVHVAEDGIARSYAANGAVIDYTPLSNEQLIKMIGSMPVATDCEEEHLMKTFATVNGFAVKDLHQIYHPSTQLRPAIDPARTHWQKDIELEKSYDCNVAFVVRGNDSKNCTID